MLVPSMTLEEMKKEMHADLPALMRKLLAQAQKAIKVMRQTNMTHLHRSYDYVSPRKNNWIYGYTCSGPSTDKCETFHMALVYRNDGFSTMHYNIDTKKFTYHTAHFFKRYNERLHLNLVNPRDKIRHFIEHCGKAPYDKLQDIKPGVFSFFAREKEGIILGVNYERFNVMKYNTFLSLDMLKGKQIEMAANLHAWSEKYNHQHETEE